MKQHELDSLPDDVVHQIRRLQSVHGLSFREVIRRYGLPKLRQFADEVKLRDESLRFKAQQTTTKSQVYKSRKRTKFSPKSLNRKRSGTKWITGEIPNKHNGIKDVDGNNIVH